MITQQVRLRSRIRTQNTNSCPSVICHSRLCPIDWMIGQPPPPELGGHSSTHNSEETETVPMPAAAPMSQDALEG